MFNFVYILKCLAAILITNSHYADIWPISALAFGGHFGNCIYFFVSGFCLANIKDPMYKWYPKRIVRIYPALWIVMAIRLLTGYDKITNGITGYINALLYPTPFHLIGSIMVLYLLFYAVKYLQKKVKINTLYIVGAVFAIFVAVYIFAFDKSTYHIDAVEENWVRFMFFASMLLGSYLREKYVSISEKISVVNILTIVGSGAVYLVLKVMLPSDTFGITKIQIISPIVCVVFIYAVVLLFIKLEKRGAFANMNKIIEKPVNIVAGMTLEIYICQRVIIDNLSSLAFPLNFIVVTLLILVCAYVVNFLSRLIQKPFLKLLYKDKKRTEVRS